MDWIYSILLLVLGQVCQMIIKHFADREQTAQLKEQTKLLKEISDSHKG